MTKSSIYTRSQDNAFTKVASFGASKESEHIYNLYDNALDNLRNTIVISKKLEGIENAKKELHEVFNESNEANWDGEGAKPVTIELFELANQFLQSLPDSLPEPDISADPDGELSMEWYGLKNKVISISISETGKISFAAISGKKSFHGIDFFNYSIPEKILTYLNELYE